MPKWVLTWPTTVQARIAAAKIKTLGKGTAGGRVREALIEPSVEAVPCDDMTDIMEANGALTRTRVGSSHCSSVLV